MEIDFVVFPLFIAKSHFLIDMIVILTYCINTVDCMLDGFWFGIGIDLGEN